MNRTDVLDLLTILGMRMTAAADQGSAMLGVTATEARAITCLREHGPLRPSVVADHLESSPRRMTQVAETLEEKRLITREPDPDDGRAKRLTLTAEGAAIGEKIATLREAWAHQLFGQLPDREVADVGDILTHLLRALPRTPHGPADARDAGVGRGG
ncbi:MarR family winged helix-turn-helix transcriptional regulator [Rhodococcus sp. NPDC054953]